MEMSLLNNLGGDHTDPGDRNHEHPLLPDNGKGVGATSGGEVDAYSPPPPPHKKKAKKKRTKKSSVLQAKLNHLAGLIGQVGEFRARSMHSGFL